MEEFIPLEVVEERNEDDVINVPEVITNTHSIKTTLTYLKRKKNKTKAMS